LLGVFNTKQTTDWLTGGLFYWGKRIGDKVGATPAQNESTKQKRRPANAAPARNLWDKTKNLDEIIKPGPLPDVVCHRIFFKLAVLFISRPLL